MLPLSQGAPRRADARPAGRARAHGRPRRGGAAARVARLIGAIVAGGGSTRFAGELKGLRTVAGERIIDRVASALRAATSDLLLVSNDPDAGTWLPGTRVVGDVRGERGSLIGIHSALTHAGEDVLVVAWDMPFVTAPLLRLIASHMSDDVFAAIPEVPVGWGLEPFCAAYSQRCLPLIESAIDAGDLRLSRLVEALPVVRRISASELAPAGDPARMFFNVNTGADLTAAEHMARGG